MFPLRRSQSQRRPFLGSEGGGTLTHIIIQILLHRIFGFTSRLRERLHFCQINFRLGCEKDRLYNPDGQENVLFAAWKRIVSGRARIAPFLPLNYRDARTVMIQNANGIKSNDNYIEKCETGAVGRALAMLGSVTQFPVTTLANKPGLQARLASRQTDPPNSTPPCP